VNVCGLFWSLKKGNWINGSNYLKQTKDKWGLTQLGKPRYSQVELIFCQDEKYNLMLTAMEFLVPLSWMKYESIMIIIVKKKLTLNRLGD
jgi:hypothetical protein